MALPPQTGELLRRIGWGLSAFVLNTLIPYAWGSMVYFGFQSNYTAMGFSRAGFISQYGSSVYQHRIASPKLVLWVHDLITAHGNPLPALTPNVFRVPGHQGEASFYEALFLHNTAFLILATWALWFALWDRPARERIPLVLLGVSLMALTQYVVVPYDTTAWLVLLIGAMLAMRKASWPLLVALPLVAAAGMAVRETIFFLPGFYLAIHWPGIIKAGALGIKRWLPHATLALMTLGTVGVYLFIRMSSGATDIAERSLLAYNLEFGFSRIGLIALLGVSSMLILYARQRWLALRIFLFSIPVLAAMVYGGNAWEIRLWTPMWLLLLTVPLAELGAQHEAKDPV